MNDGLLFEGLSELRQNLMLAVKEKYPKETEKFLKQEAKKLLKSAKQLAKKEVGTSKGVRKNWIKSKSYHQKFKIGKIYEFGESDKCIRVYNSAQHAHLVEYGHAGVSRGTKRATTRAGRAEQLKKRKITRYVDGKFVFLETELDFKSQFDADCNDFLYQFVDDTINGKL